MYEFIKYFLFKIIIDKIVRKIKKNFSYENVFSYFSYFQRYLIAVYLSSFVHNIRIYIYSVESVYLDVFYFKYERVRQRVNRKTCQRNQ